MFVLNTGYNLAPVSMGRTTTELAARWLNSQMAYVPVNSKTAHPPPHAIPGHLTRVKLRTVGNLTQKGPLDGAFDFPVKISVSGRKQKDFAILLLQLVSHVHGSLLLSIPRGFFLLLSFYIVISWNMSLFKAWSENELNKKFVVAENLAELVSKGKRFCFPWNVGDLTLFEALTDGAFDCLNWQHSGESDQNFSKKSNARVFAWGGGDGWFWN